MTFKIKEQAILINGINILSGKEALSLSKNFHLKEMWYQGMKDDIGRNRYYIVVNDLTTMLQLISFLTSICTISLKYFMKDGFTSIIELEGRK